MGAFLMSAPTVTDLEPSPPSASAQAALRLCARLASAASLADLRSLAQNELRQLIGASECEIVLGDESPLSDSSADVDARCIELNAEGERVGALWFRPALSGGASEETLSCLAEAMSASAARLRLIEQLENIKAEWRAMLDGMMDGVYVCDAGGTILRANRTFAAIQGREITSLIGDKRDALWESLPGFEVLTPWHELASSESEGEIGFVTHSREVRFGHPEQIVVETAFELAPERVASLGLSEERETRFLCVVRDTTESRRWQEQLIQTEKLAALGELTSGVAHELNNPLATVVGYAELVERDADLPERARRKLDTIHQEALRASHIVQNLLAYARRSSHDKQFVSLNEVVNATVEMRRYQLSADDVRLSLDLSENLPPIWGDSMQLQQVLLNVIGNAVQALLGWRGSGEVRISTRAISLAGRPGARLVIEDNGPGIAPDHLRRIFDPFFTTKPAGEGTGLGMSIVQRIISNHEGLIWAESRLGQGARFIIELPGAAGSETVADEIEEGTFAPRSDHLEGAHVLVVDDEEPVIMLLTEVLALDGHRVTPAFNGAEALALLKVDDFDLILSDVRMPAVGGPTFFEILQTTRPDLLERVIFVTGDTMSASTQEFLSRAGRPVIAKPFDPDELRAVVDATLRRA